MLQTITNNWLDTFGFLHLKALMPKRDIPTGTHDHLAYGEDRTDKNAVRHILVTEHEGLPILCSMSETAASELNLDCTFYSDTYYFVKQMNGHPVTIQRDDRIATSEILKTDAMRFYSLISRNEETYKEQRLSNTDPYQIVAISSAGADPFIVLKGNPGIDAFLLLFVPKSFTNTTEWLLAEDKPWEYELYLETDKYLRIPDIRKKVAD